MTTDLRAAARRLYDTRRDRDAMFGEDACGFGEPAWDMLLLLFAADRPVPIAELLAGAGAAAATSSRYVEWLTSRRLAVLGTDSTALIADRGRVLMTDFLIEQVP